MRLRKLDLFLTNNNNNKNCIYTKISLVKRVKSNSREKTSKKIEIFKTFGQEYMALELSFFTVFLVSCDKIIFFGLSSTFHDLMISNVSEFCDYIIFWSKIQIKASNMHKMSKVIKIL